MLKSYPLIMMTDINHIFPLNHTKLGSEVKLILAPTIQLYFALVLLYVPNES